jgi:hypothetical protein
MMDFHVGLSIGSSWYNLSVVRMVPLVGWTHWNAKKVYLLTLKAYPHAKNTFQLEIGWWDEKLWVKTSTIEHSDLALTNFQLSSRRGFRLILISRDPN